MYFITCDLIYFIEWNTIRLNGGSDIMIFLFNGISLLFMGFVFVIFSLVMIIVYLVIRVFFYLFNYFQYLLFL